MMPIDFNDICFHNLKSYWGILGSINPHAIIETDSAIYINTGIPSLYSPIFLNKNATALPTSDINLGSYSYWHDSLRNKRIPLEKMKELKLIMENVPVMLIDLDKNFPQEFVSDIKIKILKQNTNLNNWIIPVKNAFSMDDQTAVKYQECLEHTPQQFVHFVVEKNGLTIGSASLFLHKEIAGFYNLAVLPEFRKQGIGTALHYIRLNEAKNRGYQYATLQATPMAATLDDSLGFKTLSHLSIYEY